jgi:hypothetical protein
MATDFQAIGSALYSALGGTAGTVYYGLAPQGQAPPYILVARQSGADEYTFTSSGVSADYLVKAVSNREWPGAEAYPRYAIAHALIQNKSLTVTGYQALRCQRTTTVEYRDQQGYWHVGGVYRIDIHGTA